MDNSEKRVITNIAYYSLAFVLILFAALFIALINTRELATYQMVVYNIWAALLIIVVLADVLTTLMGNGKLLVGFAVYGIVLLFLIMAFIVYANLNVGGVIPTANADLFGTMIYFSLALSAALPFLYTMGIRAQELTYTDRD